MLRLNSGIKTFQYLYTPVPARIPVKKAPAAVSFSMRRNLHRLPAGRLFNN